MRRLPALKPTLLAALGAAVLLVSPATAQAATAHPHGITPSKETTSYVGTYPDTEAGLSACGAEGYSLFMRPGSYVSAWECLENNPYAGWNLWITWSISNCNTCVAKI